jgi:peroxiredoxin
MVNIFQRSPLPAWEVVKCPFPKTWQVGGPCCCFIEATGARIAVSSYWTFNERAQLNELGAEVVALSVDSLEQALQTVERHRLTFPVLYGLDAREVAKLIGASINEEPLYLQATGFVLRPEGTVAVAVYSSSAIGRLVAADTINFLKYLQKAQ